MELWEKVELSKHVIASALERHPRVFATCSFGKDSRVLVDLARAVRPDLLFVGIDTGYEFPETLAFAESLERETGMRLRWVRPPAEERRRIDARYGDAMVKDGRYRCCAMKLPALETVLDEFDAWITGLRRDESSSRRVLPVVEPGAPVKIHPLAFWTREDVWRYIRENGLSYHPLYDAGYASLGCAPCTTPSVAGDPAGERAGRFAGSLSAGQECGLHTADGAAPEATEDLAGPAARKRAFAGSGAGMATGR